MHNRSAALLASLALTACDLAEGLIPGGPVELSPAAHLPEESGAFESAEVQGDSIVYRGVDGDALALAPGQVIVGESDGGYLRRVERVQRDGSTITVHTSPAGLTDLMTEGKLGLEVSSAGVEPIIDCPRGLSCRAIDLLDLSGEVLFDGELGGVPTRVEITRGWVRFDPTVALDFTIASGRVEFLDVSARGALDAALDLRIHAGGPVQLAEEIDVSGPGAVIYSQPFTFYVPTPIGPLPVIGRLDLDLFAGVRADLSAEAELTAGIATQSSLRVGATYDGARWSTVGEPAVEVVPTAPVLTGSASADVTGYLRPEVRLYLYGLLGPVVAVQPSLNVVGDVAPPASPNIELIGCLTGTLDFKLDVMSLSLLEHHDSIERCQSL
jgi:hypothetical protein